jgi:hypothetical protein
MPERIRIKLNLPINLEDKLQSIAKSQGISRNVLCERILSEQVGFSHYYVVPETLLVKLDRLASILTGIQRRIPINKHSRYDNHNPIHKTTKEAEKIS